MRKTIHFTNAIWNEEELGLLSEHPVSLSTVKASGQMIVDSDQKAFVYLAEENDEFIYLYIHESVWTELQTAMKKEASLFAIGADARLQLSNWSEELSYLINNIEGNSNYGEEMVEAVEKIFLHQ
ncbi:hypothetical protein [Bacillus sp. FJAT-42315]|uniref:UPF0738 family protein n=1 Tax=Bacillus sp. FJAT-42315 TaxID=2014077 RepID=UPI000C24E7BA|nr:hypothetical protein [Bacillus sp. FJAT-42315]